MKQRASTNKSIFSFHYLFLFLLLLITQPLLSDQEESDDHFDTQHLINFAKGVSVQKPESFLESSVAMANLEGEPSALINGQVNAITGNYNDFQVDLSIPGVDPLNIERSYSGSTARNGSLAAGWNLNLYGTLDWGYGKEEDERVCHVVVTEGHGAASAYTKKLHKKRQDVRDVPISLNTRTYKQGVTNTSSGQISGQTNIRNSRAIQKKRGFEIRNGARGIKEYRFPSEKSLIHSLYREIKPSGNVFRYHYHDKLEHRNSHWRTPYDVLTKVEVKSSDDRQLAEVSYVLLSDDDYKKRPRQDVIANDGRKVRYFFEIPSEHDKRRESLLTKIERTDAPVESYKYTEAGRAGMLINRKDRPDGRFLKIKYYRNGINRIGTHYIELASDSRRIDRVHSLEAPIGHDETPIITHRFHYHFNKAENKKDRELPFRSGFTAVYDALNNKTIYTYSKDQRLTHIDKFFPNGEVYTRESLYWADEESDQCSYLLSRSLRSPEGLVFARAYTYDDRGNVLKDSFYGNLSGHSAIAPAISQNDGRVIENGSESFQKQFRYSDDGFNLLLWESDGISETSYQYEWQSNRLCAKYVGEPNKILLREFYEYNTEAALTKKIVDDGSSTDKNDLTNVTERHLTYYTPRTVYPFGYPEVITEKYLEMASGQEIQKNRVVNTHNNLGLLVEQKHYDSSDKYLYTLYWDYNAMGKLIKEVDALNNVSEWRYDPNGNCVYEQGPDPLVYKNYIYDYSNRLVRLEEIHKDSSNKITSYRYNLLSQLIAVTDFHGNETRYDYDPFGRVVQITYPQVLNEEGVPSIPRMQKSYDPMGNITKIVDCKGNEKLMSYTTRSQLAKVVYPDGSTESNTYTLGGQLQSSCSKNGTTTHFTYDTFGRKIRTEIKSPSGELLSTTSATYNAFHLISETDAMGQTTFYTYYSDGKLKSKQCGQLLTAMSYDNLGRLHKTIEYYGFNVEDAIVKVLSYDILNRITEERTLNGKGKLFNIVSNSYDKLGRLICTCTGSETRTSTEYNSDGIPITTTDAEGNQTQIKSSFDFVNSIGQKVDYKEITDPLGNKIITISDALGRIVTTQRKSKTDNLLQKQEKAYDLNGNICRLTDTIIREGSEHGIVTKLHYDAMNRLVLSEEAADTPEQKFTILEYNLYGQKISTKKADGISLFYDYDLLGRLSSFYSSDNSINYNYTYDLNNHPLRVDDLIHGSATIKEFDDSGRLIKETLGHGYSLNYEYDAMGRPTQVTLPDGSSFAFKYEVHLDKAQRISKNGELIYEHAYLDYDLCGRLKHAKLIGKAGELRNSFDKNGNLINFQTNCWEEKLAYDVVSNLIEQQYRDVNGEVLCKYSYDDLYQIKSENGSANHSYQYDSHYNRIKKDGKLHVHNDLNQILDDGEAIYTYDQNGNLEKKVTAHQTLYFCYDALDRLISLSNGNQKVNYVYDENNRRLSKEIIQLDSNKDNVKTLYLYQGQNEIGALNTEGKILELRLLGIGKGAEIGAAVALELEGKVFAPVHDHAGHVICLIDAETGDEAETYRYSAFGEELFEDAMSPWRFSSKRVDSESGFVYFGRRYYDSLTGRWISQDPIGREGGPNLYAYVLNSPLNHFDLYGLHIVPDRWRVNCGQPGFGRLFQGISYGIRYLCDTWQRQFPIPYVRDVFSAAHHFCTNGGFKGFKMEHQGAHSRNGQVYGIDLYKDVSIIYTPGINNTYESTIEGAEAISRSHANSTVHFCHNKDHGFISDIGEVYCQKGNIPTHSSSKLAQLTKEQLGKVGPSGKVIQYGFSQGGQIIDTLRTHLTPSELKQQNVITFGSAKMASKKVFGDAMNYVSIWDPIPFICDPIGIVKSFFSNDIKVKFLMSKDYPITSDHMFLSETYQGALAGEGSYYLKTHLEGMK